MEPIKTTEKDGKVKLRLDIDNLIEPLTVPQFFDNVVDNYPDAIALSYKQVDETWYDITYEEYRNLVHLCAKGFLKLGLQRYHGVCILGFNSVEWFVSLLGGIHAGGIVAGIYTTNSVDACEYCFDNCKANIVVCDDAKQVEKVLEVQNKLPNLKKIIQYSGKTVPSKYVMSWKELLKLGESESNLRLEKILKSLVINECCTLVYTSGTTGNPKAVMLSHDNIIYATSTYNRSLTLREAKEVVVSYLPLSHIAAQIVDVYTVMSVAGRIYFADKSALKGTLVNTLKEAQPTVFIGVPRVWEKFYEKMTQLGAQTTGFKKNIATFAKSIGLKHSLNIISHTFDCLNSLSYVIVNKIIFNKIKEALGFSRCKLYLTAGAPLDEEIKKYFMSLDIIIVEAYGMSECCGAHSINFAENYRAESIGLACKNFQTQIFNQDSNGEGEICMRGRHVFMGYLNDLENTNETLDDEGWLHSGDMGKIDDDGFLYITGRIKELLITAGGENIPPVRIENLLKNELSVVSNCMLVGDKKKFLTMLIAFKTKIDEETGAPLDEFTEETKTWLKSLNCNANSVTELMKLNNPKVKTEIQEAINRVNKQAISNAQKIQKFAILPADFSVATGELGPTLKAKRKVILLKYQDIINDLYKD